MITINNKTYRNLEEQVQKNMEDINKFAQGTQVLADFGIKIVGHIDDSSDLPDPTEYDGDYGDAYIVGEEDPYDYWIFTRAQVGEENPYWFDLGPFPVPGPQGEQGPQGEIGETPIVNMEIGSVSTLNYDQSATASIVASGTDENPLFTLNLAIPQGAQGIQGQTGPQGPTGPQGQKGDKGDKGDQGGLIEIVGIVATADLLPTPVSLNKLDAAYLVGTEGDYELYVQVGDNPATAIWTNIGYFNSASVVTTNGTPQPVWESDTKVSVSEGHLVNTLYGQASGTGNGQTHVPYGTAVAGNAVVQRDANGQVIVPETPTADGQAASKKYVDTTVAGASPIQYAGDIIVGNLSGKEGRLAIGSAGQFLKVNAQANGLEYSSISQVPSYTSGNAGQFLKVNSSGNALEWDVAGGGGGSGSIANYKNLSNILYGGSNPDNVTKIVNSSNQTVLTASQDYGIILCGSTNTNLGDLTYSTKYVYSGLSTAFRKSILLGTYRDSSSASTLYVPNAWNSIASLDNKYNNTAPLVNSLVLTDAQATTGTSNANLHGCGILNSIALGCKTQYDIKWSILAGPNNNPLFAQNHNQGTVGSIMLGGAIGGLSVPASSVIYLTTPDPQYISNNGGHSIVASTAKQSLLLLNAKTDSNTAELCARAISNTLILSDSSHYITTGSSGTTSNNYSLLGTTIVGRSFNIQANSAGYEGAVVLGYGHLMYNSSIDASVIESTTSDGDVIRGRTIVGKCGTYSSTNYTDMFMVGAGTATNARANCFATGNDGTYDYIKIGDTKITENAISSYKHYVCITDSDSNYHKFIFKSSVSTAYTSISDLMTDLISRCILERVTYVDPTSNSGSTSADDLYYGNICMISGDSTNGYSLYYTIPMVDGETGDESLENTINVLDITSATISDTVTSL